MFDNPDFLTRLLNKVAACVSNEPFSRRLSNFFESLNVLKLSAHFLSGSLQLTQREPTGANFIDDLTGPDKEFGGLLVFAECGIIEALHKQLGHGGHEAAAIEPNWYGIKHFYNFRSSFMPTLW